MGVLSVLDPADGQLMLQTDGKGAVFQKEDGILLVLIDQGVHFLLCGGQPHRSESVKLGTALKTLHLCCRKVSLIFGQSLEPVGAAFIGRRQIIIPWFAVTGIIPVPAVAVGQIIKFIIRMPAGFENDGRFLSGKVHSRHLFDLLFGLGVYHDDALGFGSQVGPSPG